MTFFTVINTSSSNAQLIRTYGFKAGFIKAEQQWDYSPQSGIHASGIGLIWGFDGGAFIELFNFQNFSLLTELHYIQKGRTVTVIATAAADNPQGYIDLGPEEIKQRFEYISIPVLAKLRIENDMVTPYIALGPRLEYLVAHPPSPVYDKFNKIELAVTGAAGVELYFGFTPKFLFEVNYSLDLTNSYKNENVTVNNRSISFLFGAEF